MLPDAAWSPPGPPVRTRGGADIIPTRGIGGGARRSVVSVEGIETNRLTRLRRILPRASSAKGGFIIGDVPRRRRGHPGRVPTDGARHDPRRDGPPTNGRRRRARVTLRRDRTIIPTPPRCDTAAAATRTATGAAGPTPAATRTPPPRSTSSTPPSRAACTMGDTRSPRLRDRTGTQPEGRGTASRGPSATAAGASRASATAAPARNDARIDCSPRRTATGSTATGQPRRRRRS